MRWSAVKILYKINLIQSNVRQLTNVRKKNKAKETDEQLSVMKNIWINQVMGFVSVLFITFFLLGSVALTGYPGLMTNFLLMMGLFFIMTCSQSFSNLVLEAKDLEGFQPLPFSRQEIFMGKVLTLGTVVMPFVVAVAMTLARIGFHWIYGIIMGLILALLFLFLFASLSLFLLESLFKIPWLAKHQKLVMYLFYGVVVVFWFIRYIQIIQFNNGIMMEESSTRDFTELPILNSFYYVMRDPTQFKHWGIILVLAVVAFLSLRYVTQHFGQTFTQETEKNNQQIKTDAMGNGKNLPHMIRRYNIKQLKNPSLVLQIMMNECIFLIAFSFGIIQVMREMRLLPNLAPDYFGIFIILGFMMTVLMKESISFGRVILSVDKENYTFMASLPITRRAYFIEKYKLVTAIEFSLSFVVISLLLLIMHATVFQITMNTLGVLLCTIVMSFAHMKYDYHNMVLDWQNLEDLIFRKGKFASIGIAIVITFGLFFIIGGVIASYYFVPETAILSFVYTSVLLVACLCYYFFSVRPFMKKL